MKKPQLAAFVSIDSADLAHVQGGSDTRKDQWDGAGNSGYKDNTWRKGDRPPVIDPTPKAASWS